MYEMEVNDEFCAAHAIVMDRQREPVHGHNWRVTLTIAGPTVDHDGLLCDFHEVQAVLSDAIGAFHNANLNEVPPFDTINPTAEHVARHIATTCQKTLRKTLPKGARVAACRVTEAPGCAATYRPATDDA
jgi:6-pyruvoyltetrahydropterin/6-carboxytetrahydropterin synthase